MPQVRSGNPYSITNKKESQISSGEQRKEMYSMWPHWEEGRRDAATSPRVLRVVKWDQSLNRGPGICRSKQSWSRCGPIHGSSLVWAAVSL